MDTTSPGAARTHKTVVAAGAGPSHSWQEDWA
jgi:hypothetical protein